MNLTTLPLLESTVNGIPSGNYDGSSLDFVGNAQIAVNYYGGQGSIQTVTISTTDFTGDIRLEATLNDSQAVNTDQAYWFEVDQYLRLLPSTQIYPVTLTGNFTYMRARILDFETGTINAITITY
jgi:allantoicase